MSLILYDCPTCGVKGNDPCRTPAGRRREAIHDTRPFGITFDKPLVSGSELREAYTSERSERGE